MSPYSLLVISFRCWICNTKPTVCIIDFALQHVCCYSVSMSFHFQYCSCMFSVRVCVSSHCWCCSSSAVISSSFSLWRPISAFCRLMISLYLLSSSSQRGRSSSRHFNYRTTRTLIELKNLLISWTCTGVQALICMTNLGAQSTELIHALFETPFQVFQLFGLHSVHLPDALSSTLDIYPLFHFESAHISIF